jgi:hypothetical protein
MIFLFLKKMGVREKMYIVFTKATKSPLDEHISPFKLLR